MDENPYQAPLEQCGPQMPEDGDWPATLRDWALGPDAPPALFLLTGALMMLRALLSATH